MIPQNKRILLIRHGRPSESLSGSIALNEIESKIARYNEASIVDRPSEQLCRKAREFNYVVTSGLIRSIDSAKALGFSTIHQSKVEFGEVKLPYLTRGKFTAPVMFWARLFRILSVFGFSLNGESLFQARRRARSIASSLVHSANQHHSVVFVGHGFINHLVANELRKTGWTGPRKLDSQHWGHGEYQIS